MDHNYWRTLIATKLIAIVLMNRLVVEKTRNLIELILSFVIAGYVTSHNRSNGLSNCPQAEENSRNFVLPVKTTRKCDAPINVFRV